MKYYVCLTLLVCLLSQVNSMIPVPEIHQYKDVCAAELQIDTSSWPSPPSHPGDGPPSGNGPPPAFKEPDHDGKCLMNCMLRKAGVIDSNGVLQVNQLRLPPDAANVDIDKCAKLTDSDPCQQTFLIETCIREQLPRPTPPS